MSDVAGGPGWWKATDGKWYPAEAHPNTVLQQQAQQEPQGKSSEPSISEAAHTGVAQPTPEITFYYVTYHGGFTHLNFTSAVGDLRFTDDCLVLLDNDRNLKESRRRKWELCRAGAISAVEVSSEQVAKSKLGATLIFGVVGGVTAKATKDRTTLIVHLKSGATGYFSIDLVSAAEILGPLTPWLSSRKISIGAPTPAAGAPSGPAPSLISDELERLAEMRDKGVLTEDEFAALKAKLITDFMGTPPPA